jgi:predicted ATP-grasp superfamily ATP-dependent carboligase
MHFFLYEWCSGGGLVNEPGALPATLVREGVAMVGALAGDLVRIEGARVTALRDPRVVHLNLHGGTIIDVQSRAAHFEEFERLAAEADATILIAPEFDNVLLKAAQLSTAAGARLLSPPAEFIRLTANKHKTCERLASAGVPVPQGILLHGDEKLPGDFRYPAVLKPVDGAGSQDTLVVAGSYDEPPPYAFPRRLEQLAPGLAASVSFLCGPAGNVTLMPCKQRISEDGRLRYLGGALPLAEGLAKRAKSLGERAMAALPRATGYVGVDFVLGREPNGSEDVVIEVNPRLTTSYVGLRAVAKANLAAAMVRVASGDATLVEFADRRLEFDVDGNVSFLP